MKYKVGDKVKIKSIDWYNENKTSDFGDIDCGAMPFMCDMSEFCNKIVTISNVNCKDEYYEIEEDNFANGWTDEMIEGLVEEEGKETSWKPSKEEMDVLYGLAYITNKYDEHKEEVITRLYQDLKREFFNGSSYENMFPNTENDVRRRSTIQVLEYARSLDNYNQYGKTDIDKNIAWLEKIGLVDNLSSRWVNEFNLPEGYIFKDENGNEILTNKIILEKVNTLKIKNDNMETETHRGYYTIEEETTNKSKKVAWFTFWDNDFADKVELDLSNRELIQEDGKWFVVKKKNEYPKTYEECCDVLSISLYYNLRYHTYEHGYGEFAASNELLSLQDKLNTLSKLIICRNAYWKIAGEEMGLGKPWEPDYTNEGKKKFSIWVDFGEIKLGGPFTTTQMVLSFPTEEMRDAFYENFKDLIEQCKELL